MKAGHGRHPQTAGTTPRALPSGPGPHPDEDKEPEQEFVPGLVSRQGFVIPALSGMRSAHGKFPDLQISGGTWHLAPGPGARLPGSSSIHRDAPCPPCSPRCPSAAAPQLQTGSSRDSPGVSASSLSRGNQGPSSLDVPEVVGQEWQRGESWTRSWGRQRPALLQAQPCQGIWEDFRPFCVFPKRRK